MKKIIAIALLAACLAPALLARDIEPVVSVAWLEQNLSDARLVVMDMRKVEDYKVSHVPGAVNVVGTAVYVKKGDINNEVPEMDDLSDLLSDAGVTADSLVVVVETDAARFAWATRVAWTLKYAGLENVAVLDGGYAAWTKAGKAVQTDVVRKKGSYEAKAVAGYFADKAAVLKAVGAQVLDNRSYDTYFGLAKQAFVAQAGHFPGAYSLPNSWITNAEGLVKPKAELAAMAAKLGLDPAIETFTYCDSGVLCTTWWWVLSEMLGWNSVRSFDGSSQVMAADQNVRYITQAWR
ncbi:MAG: rhodanese-like domain-containing protein [Spirochaetaceae bacterium]|nr:rhodanese-like domain-containing protein [Spirochaetaceae bacterium]